MKTFNKLLAFILGFVCGILSVFGGVAWAATSIDLVWLEKNFGIDLGISSKDDAEVDIKGLSLVELLAELSNYMNNPDALTVLQFEKRYGVDINQILGGSFVIPDSLKSMPLLSLFSEDGINKIMSSTKVGVLLEFVPGIVDERTNNLIKDFYISQLVDFDVNSPVNIYSVLADVKVGGLLGYTYDSTSNKYFPPSGSADAFMDIIANSDAGALLNGVLVSGDVLQILDGKMIGDLMGFTREAIAETAPVEFRWLDKDGNVIDKTTSLIADTSISDLLGGNFNIDTLLGDIYIGELMGFTQGEVTDATTTPLKYQWIKANGENADITMNSLANTKISALLSGQFDIANMFEGLKLGDLMGYTYNDSEQHWYQGNVKVDATMNSLSNTLLSDLLNGNFSIESALGNMYVGELMGYTQGEITDNTTTPFKYQWKDSLGNDVDATINAIANIKVEKLLSGEIDVNDLLSGLKLGDMMGYTFGCVSNSHIDGEICLVGWFKSDTDGVKTQADAVTSALANQGIESILNGSIDINNIMGDLYMGDIMKLFNNGDCLNIDHNEATETNHTYTWFKDSQLTIPADNLTNTLANSKLSDIINNPNSIIDDMKLSDIIGTGNAGILGQMEDWQIKDINQEKLNDIQLGYALGLFEKDGIWYSDESMQTEADGINGALAGITIGNLNIINPETNKTYLMSAINNIKLSDIIGVDNSGILGQLENVKVGDLSSSIDNIKLGYALGLFEKDGIWYSDELMLKEANGLNSALAGITIGNINKTNPLTGKTYLMSAIDTVKLGEILGYNNSGILGQLENKPISDLSSSISSLKLGYAFGLYYNTETDKWYSDELMQTEANGLNSALAGIAIDDINKIDPATNKTYLMSAIDKVELGDILVIGVDDRGILAQLRNTPIGKLVSEVDKVKLGHIMGFFTDDDTVADAIWYDHRTDRTEAYRVKGINARLVNHTLATLSSAADEVNNWTLNDVLPTREGILAKIPGNTKVGELGKAVDDLYLGDVLGYKLTATCLGTATHTHTSDCWEKGGVAPTGVDKALVNLTIKSMSEAGAMMKAVNGLALTDLFPDVKPGEGAFGIILKYAPNTTIETLPTSTAVAFSRATIGELIDADIITGLDESNINKINGLGDWRNLKTSEFISKLIEVILALQSAIPTP